MKSLFKRKSQLINGKTCQQKVYLQFLAEKGVLHGEVQEQVLIIVLNSNLAQVSSSSTRTTKHITLQFIYSMRMKILFFLLLPVFSFGQSKLDTVSILNGKVKLLAPKELSPMSDEMYQAKYRNPNKPTMILTDEDGAVNLIASMTDQAATENQLADFKDFQFKQLKAKRPDLKLLNEGVKTVNGRKLAYFKFLSQAIDQKVFNYYFFTLVDGKILLFTFNCVERLQKKWEPTADNIVASLIIK